MQKVSFKQILDQNKVQTWQQGNLFTKLKQDLSTKTTKSIPNQSIFASDHHQHQQEELTLETVLGQCQFQLQILKLQKANFIAVQVLEFGLSFQEVFNRIQKCISADIQQIIKQKYHKKLVSRLKDQESTVDNTESLRKQWKKNSAVKNTLTPKIVEFTLGNRQASSGRSYNHDDSKNGEEVSQFFVGAKGAASKSIRQKVMGARKLK